MKCTFLTIAILFSLKIFAQFPAPTDFDVKIEYVEMGNWTDCGGEAINGPAYCSRFKWSTPDTLTTTATLESYKIYYYSNYENDTNIVATLTDTIYIDELGIIGKVWVTAVYSNPNGESSASNIVENNDLPISIEKVSVSDKNQIYFDRDLQILVIKNTESYTNIRVFNSKGQLVKTSDNSDNILKLTGLNSEQLTFTDLR